MKKLYSLISVFGLLILAALFGWASIASATLQVVQTRPYHLYGAESGSATSMTITPYPVDLDGVKLTMTDFGTTPTVTVDPGLIGTEEIESFTGITDNGNNTATLTGLSRDLQSKYPYTGTGTGRPHGSGAFVVFGNNPQIYGRLASKENNETITGQWTFNTFPITPANSTSSETVAGVVQLGTAAQTAASNSTGSTGARTVIPTSLATSTWSSSLTAGYIPTTGSGGVIATGFLPPLATSTASFANGDLFQRIGMHFFVATTTQVWSVATGTIYADVQCVGAGGGGGGGATGSSYAYTASGGGGGGAYIRETVNLTSTSSVLITIGQGGNGGAPNGNGGTGGNTSFGNYLTANGGNGGSVSGSGSETAAGGGFGGTASSTASTTVISIPGGNGEGGFAISPTNGLLSIGGFGGSSFFGEGAQGSVIVSGVAQGATSTIWGGGGSGASGLADTLETGGGGDNGVCIIRW